MKKAKKAAKKNRKRKHVPGKWFQIFVGARLMEVLWARNRTDLKAYIEKERLNYPKSWKAVDLVG